MVHEKFEIIEVIFIDLFIHTDRWNACASFQNYLFIDSRITALCGYCVVFLSKILYPDCFSSLICEMSSNNDGELTFDRLASFQGKSLALIRLPREPGISTGDEPALARMELALPAACGYNTTPPQRHSPTHTHEHNFGIGTTTNFSFWLI